MKNNFSGKAGKPAFIKVTKSRRAFCFSGRIMAAFLFIAVFVFVFSGAGLCTFAEETAGEKEPDKKAGNEETLDPASGTASEISMQAKEIEEQLKALETLYENMAGRMEKAPGCESQTLFQTKLFMLPSGETFEKAPFQNEYLMMKTCDTGFTFDAGYPFQELTDSFRGMFSLLSTFTGGATENPAVWGNAWHFAEMMLKRSTVTDPDQVPKWFPESGEKTFSVLWTELIDAASRGNTQGVLSLLNEFAADSGNYYYTAGSNSAKQWYVMYLYDCTTPVINGFYTSEGKEAYCLQWNEPFPQGSAVNQADSEEAVREALALSEENYKKLLSILHRGYPLNAGLSGTPYENYPAEALKEGTQAAVWAFLGEAGAKGNQGTGDGGAGIVTLEGIRNLTDPKLNQDGSTYDVKAYAAYLLNGASVESGTPVVEFSREEGVTLTKEGTFTVKFSVTGAFSEGGIRLAFENLPAGAALFTESGTEIAEDPENPGEFMLPENYNGSDHITHTYRLFFPSKGNGNLEIRAYALGRTGMPAENLSLLFSDYTDRQLMASLSLSEEAFAKSEEIAFKTPASSLTIKKTGEEGNPLSGAVFRLLDSKKKTVGEGETKEGLLAFYGLQPGESYTLFEITAPDGYVLSEELENGTRITLPENQLTLEVNLKNEPEPEPETEPESSTDPSTEEPSTEEPTAPEDPSEPEEPSETEDPEEPETEPETSAPEEETVPEDTPSAPVVLGVERNYVLPAILLFAGGVLLAVLLFGRKPHGPKGAPADCLNLSYEG